MTDFKKGGPLQNSNIYATNRLFVKNPLFKKKKKKRAPGVYNPKAKFKYEKGGEQGCPPGQQWNPYTKRCEPKLEDRTFLNLMRDRKYGALQQFKLAPKSSYNPKYIQNLKEVTITASKKAKAKKNKKKTDTFSSDYEKLVEQYDKLKNSPLLANQEQANNLLNQIKDIELYNPGSTRKNLYRGERLEDQINNLLDKAQDKASISANAITEDGNDEIDNFRHPQAGRYAAEAIVNYFPEWAQYTGIPQIAGFLGANAMGVAHEIGTLPYDERSWSTKLAESGEDIFNNAVGAGVGVLPMNSRDKTNALLELSKQNMLPDGIVDENPANNLYLKKRPNDPGKFKSPYKQELGGSIMDLTEEEIQKYIDGGYVVEEVNDPSIPALNRFDNGGDTKPGVQNLPETTIYDPKSKKIQLNLLQQLDTAKKAYQNYTKQNKGKKWKLNIADASSSIEDIKKGIQLYKDEFKKEKEETERELKRLESLKNKSAFKDNKDIQNLTLKDLSTVKGKAKLLDAARSSNLSGDEVAALYKGWGLDQADYNVKKGSGSDAVYSAKETKAAAMKDVPQFVNMVSNVATAIPLLGAAGAAGTAGAAILENPYVQAGLTGYGLYDATTNTIPEAYKDFSEGRYLEGAGNVALAGLDLVPGVGLAGKGAKLAGKGLGKIGTKLDQAIYPTRAYRSEALTGNTGFGEQSELAKKVFEKGDWATKSPKEAFHYLKGSEYADESTGLLGGQDMKFTEYKIPFWKKDVSFDPDVAELKKLQGEKINTNEFIVPNKTALDRFLYPSRSTTIKAVPENVKAELTPTQFAPEGVPLYYPGSMPAGTTSDLYASPAYKYIEDQLNAVTGHELPITHQYGSGNYPIQNYIEPQFAPNEGLGKFTRFSSSSPGFSNKSVTDRLKQFFDRPPGPMMLLGSSGGNNMVKKNMNYYKQLLDSYDGKKMSASNRKFYNDLIESGKKQDGMLTEAQLRELDRLKNSNFDFGKRGYNKESLLQAEPKAPVETPQSNFKSEIDWENWVKNKEDVYNNPDVIKELNTIEETTKANGTWMKNADGTPFKGSPEQFVVQQSSRYKTAYPEGTDVVHRGVHKNSAPTSGTEESSVIFTGDAPTAAQYIGHIDDVKRPLIKGLNENPLESPQNIITKYYDDAKNWTNQDPAETIQKEIFDAGKNLDDEVLGLYTPKTDNKIIIEGAESPGFNRAFNRLNVEKEFGLNNNSLGQKEELQKFTNWMKENFPDRNLSDNVMTDHFAKYLNEGNSGLQRVDFNNITDPNILGNVQAMKVGPGNYLKSIRGNILFDMNNPDIYKAIIPTAGVTGLTGLMMNNFSSNIPQQKKGGATDDYIEVDIPEEEIQWYIDNGYRVEPVTKLKKFIG